jgi:hypothetical protein
MNKTTKRIGWIILAITELMICFAFITDIPGRPTYIGSQIIVFTAVWGAVSFKNHIDYKTRELNIPEEAKGL